MDPWLEILIPVRNPGAALCHTVDSLLAQTDRNFTVVFSDNFSSTGLEQIADAERRLFAAGIFVRRIRPPFELRRVAHWNWIHSRAYANWLKPLFVGDTLRPGYVSCLHHRVQERPNSAIVRCEFIIGEDQNQQGSIPRAPFSESAVTPQQFLAWFPEHGNWIGRPVNLAYRRDAWRATGGYAAHLPCHADLDLFVSLALRYGLENIPETLAVFQPGEERFSFRLRERRLRLAVEMWLVLRQAQIYCRNAKLYWPEHGIARGVWQQLWRDY